VSCSDVMESTCSLITHTSILITFQLNLGLAGPISVFFHQLSFRRSFRDKWHRFLSEGSFFRRRYNGLPYASGLLSRPVSNVGVLRPNRWMDQDATWYGGRPQSRPHCVRWGPTARKWTQQHPPTFRLTLLWQGRPSQQLLSSCSVTQPTVSKR